MSNRFTIVSAADGGAPFARAACDHQRKSFVASPGPENRFSKPGYAQDRDALGIHGSIGFQIIHGAAQPPGPRCDRAPLIGSRLALAGLQKQRAHSRLKAAGEIGINIAVVDGSKAETRCEQTNHVDLSKCPALIGGNSVLIRTPDLAGFDAWIIYGIRVRRETEVQQKRDGLLRESWEIEKQVHLLVG